MRKTERRCGLKAVYNVPELADLMGKSTWSVRRWLARNQVETVRNGNDIWVPLTALANAFPAIYVSLMTVAAQRRTEET